MANDEELHEHDRGLSHDLPTLLSRRRALAWLGGTGLAVALAGCGVTGNDGTGDTSGAAGAASTAGSSGTVIPEETAGPYPGDGSNGVNVLTESGIVRSDITRSFGSASGVAKGVPLTIRLRSWTPPTGRSGARAPPSTCGTATSTAATRCTPRASPRRTTCVGCRRPAATGRSPSPASSRRPTRDAGRTSTSRSTRAWRR